MKVLGKFMDGFNSARFAIGGYAALDVKWIHVETASDASVKKDNRCLLRLGTSYLIINIKNIDGTYLTPEFANSLVKTIASKELLDLDEYDLGFFGAWDVRPYGIDVRNELDDNYNAIPLEVVVVSSKS